MTENEHYILKKVSKPALYEQLAEECTELAQASLKMARKLRGENPTPKDENEIMTNIVEECSDVVGCLRIIGIHPDKATMANKNERWVKRLKTMEEVK